MAIVKRIIKGAPITAQEMDANLTILEQTSGSFTALMTGSFLAVSQSISNLSTLQGTLSGQFTGSALISGSNSSLIISGALKIADGILANDTSTNRVLVHNLATNTIGWNTVAGVSTSGTSGTSGVVGPQGTGGSGGTSGTSGLNGTFFGTSGTSGANGTSGSSGSSGTSGINGTSGSSGVSGTNGTAGSGGTSGVSGTNGSAGTSGVSIDANLTNRLMQATASLNTFTGSIRGEVSGLETYTASLKNSGIISGAAQITALGFGGSGIFTQTGSFYSTNANLQISGSLSASLANGYMWVGGPGNVSRLITTASLTAGALTLNGFTLNGVVTFNVPNSTVNSNLLFDGSLLTVNGRISSSNAITASLREGYAWVGGAGSVSVLVATSSFGSGIFTQIGTSNAYGTGNDVQLSGSFSASLASGYTWVGGANNITRLVPTSSFGGSVGVKNYLGATYGAFNQTGVTSLAFSGSAVTLYDNGGGEVKIEVSGTGGGGSNGTSGTSGTSVGGASGTNGTSGTSGSSGVNGLGGTNGTSGSSGLSAVAGTAGTGGSSGSSGTSGVDGNGTSGSSGTSGLPGEAGTSGSSGSSGSSGLSGAGGGAGTSGSSGSSGSSGALTLTGTTDNGIITYDNVTSNGAVEADLRWIGGGTKEMTVSGSINLYSALNLVPQGSAPFSVSSAGYLYASGSALSASLMFYDGNSWRKVNLI